jgi:hypothetical protein
MDERTAKPQTPVSPARLSHNSKSPEVIDHDAFEWEKLRLERQKYALEVRLKRQEIQERNGKGVWKDLLTNPVTIAIVGGIITLVTAVVTNYFNASEGRQAEAAKAKLASESAKETLQADLIKKFVESPRTETVRQNLRFLADAGLIPRYAESIKRYLDSNPGVAPRVGGGIEFSPSGVLVADNIKAQIGDAVNRFTAYLQNLGFTGLDQTVSVFVYSKEHPPPVEIHLSGDVINAFFIGNVIYVHERMAGNASVGNISAILWNYASHALSMTSDSSSKAVTHEIDSALTDYLTASFLDSPIIGASLGPVIGLKTSFIRTLDNSALYERSPNPVVRGAVWAAALWACRVRVGQQAVDGLILPAWRQAMGAGHDNVDRIAEEFGKALTSATPPLGSCFSTEANSRKLP